VGERERGVLPAMKKKRGGGVRLKNSGPKPLVRIRTGGGTPTPSCDHPTPLVLSREGWSPLPLTPVTPRETHLLELERWGGSPLFCAEQGGWGSVHEKRKPGGGGWLKFRRAPPLPGILGEGWGVRWEFLMGVLLSDPHMQ